MNENIVLRIRDVALCLLGAKEYDIQLSKIQLQKLIYLLDCVESFLYVLLQEKGHQTYYHGPYDKNIQNAADILVFNLMCEANNIKILEKGDVSCSYKISNEGEAWISNIVENDIITEKRSLIVKGLLQSLTSRELINDIIKLVYSEPIFVSNRKNGYGYNLNFMDLDQNDVFTFLTLILDVFEKEKKEIYVPFICDILIDYLNKRSKSLAIMNNEV